MPRVASAAVGRRRSGLYAALAAETRRLHARHEEMNVYAAEVGMGGPWPSPYAERLALFDAGRPVVVPAWQLTGHRMRAAGVEVALPPRAERARLWEVAAGDVMSPMP